MLEVRDEFANCIHDLGFREILFGKQVFQFLEESVHLRHRPAGGFLHHTQSHKAVHVDALTRDVELLVSLPSTSSG